MAEASSWFLVAAIDFGTAFSGYAYSFRHEYESDPTKINTKIWYSNTGHMATKQASTCILLKPDQTFHSFGYDAENMYSQLAVDDEHGKWYFFGDFKMKLLVQNGLGRKLNLEDATGKPLPALLIFSLAIKFLKDDLMTEIQNKVAGIEEKDVRWVITTPAIWSDAAKQFMREAAVKAGIKSESLEIALEPEAAAVYCKYLKLEKKTDPGGAAMQSLPIGTKYVVLDAGGGTVDITVHEVISDHSLRELHIASGGPWGGTMVDEEFRKLLIKIVGSPVMGKFKKAYMDEYIDLTREFEVKKREIKSDSDSKVTIRVPSLLRELFQKMTGENIEEAIEQMDISGKVKWRRDKLQLDAEMMKGFFNIPIRHIIRHLRKLLRKKKMKDVSNILMVGGFSESEILQSAIKSEFKSIKILIPQAAGEAVLAGAVNYGYDPTIIGERKCKHTYGIHTSDYFIEGRHDESLSWFDANGEKRCKHIFSRHVRIGQSLRTGEWEDELDYEQSDSTLREQLIEVFASFHRNPIYVTDTGCMRLGALHLPLPAAIEGEVRKISVQMCYSGTELAVKGKCLKTGETVKGYFDFLE